MAERAQYQYQPVTGPVWSEPVASRMQWLPQGREFARGLPPNRLGDFVQPPFDALYKPQRLEWTPAGQRPAYSLPPNKLGDFARPEFAALYPPERLEWQSKDFYVGRTQSRAAYDYSVLVQLVSAAAYDPQNLEWFASAAYPQVPVEKRSLGDFQQPELYPYPVVVVPPPAAVGGGGGSGRPVWITRRKSLKQELDEVVARIGTLGEPLGEPLREAAREVVREQAKKDAPRARISPPDLTSARRELSAVRVRVQELEEAAREAASEADDEEVLLLAD